MQHAASFARHLARLVWIVRHESQAIEAQKVALREMVAELADAPVTLSVQSLRLTADDTQLPDDGMGVHELAIRMLAHGSTRLYFPEATPPAELLALARLMAEDAPPRSTVETVRQRLATAKVERINAGVVAPSTGEFTAFPIPDGEETVMGAAASRALPPAPTSRVLRSLLERARTATAPHELATTFDEIIAAARASFNRGDVDTLVDAAHAVLAMEKYSGREELAHRLRDTLRRLLSPAVLKAVVQLVPRQPERYNVYLDLLERAKQGGAEAVVAQLSGATSIAERRVFYDVLGKLEQAVPVLVLMLNDDRWYVVRNAVDLLGSLGDVTVEPAVAKALGHADERVRRAAALALAKLGTPSAQRDLYRALHEVSNPVRHMAAMAIVTREGDRAVATLVEALDRGADDHVLKAIVMALGRVGSPEAVTALARTARATSGFFDRRRSIEVRVAAIQALGEAGTTEAVSALRELTHDPEKQVRGAAIWAVKSKDSGVEGRGSRTERGAGTSRNPPPPHADPSEPNES
ncbi:MAG TPA: HEAT repeat domain-containing protein [Gemmatimonadaceae bacterium]|nr:HEAT repeat domain-containing protein [Gemmatimonadaceae bacterium]